MQDGFVNVAACAPKIRVADVRHNANACIEAVRGLVERGAKVIVLPELCVTGSTCGDLFWQETLLKGAEDAISTIAQLTADCDALVFVGAPVRVGLKLYDCAVALSHARIVGIVPKRHLSVSEARYFSVGPTEARSVPFAGSAAVTFGADQVFCCTEMPSLSIEVTIGDDLFYVAPNGCASIVANLAATPALVGSAAQARRSVAEQSARLLCACVKANAGEGESTTDYVFSGQSLVAQRGAILSEGKPFARGAALATVDVSLLCAERRRVSSVAKSAEQHRVRTTTEFDLNIVQTRLVQKPDAFPFIPNDESKREDRCEEILSIQAHALAQRMSAIGCEKAIIGISGGLDSTLALLVTARAFDVLGLDRAGITAITMPGFGTTDRTHNNAWQLTLALGATPREIAIGASVRQHFADIGHDESVHNAAYENAQARERTQILMDVANDNGGIVVGTGDLSELALGWATYNGDHMSMYAVNAAIPKTLIRYIVRHVADTCGNEREAEVLLDVLDTPVSPELLPANDDGTIAQQTEDLVGPYELHDFFVYQLLRYGYSMRKIYRLACAAFEGTYDAATVLKWLKVFCRRFFSQQFKRSCAPDGPAVGSVGLSPRGGLVMPSDASSALWLEKLS